MPGVRKEIILKNLITIFKKRLLKNAEKRKYRKEFEKYNEPRGCRDRRKVNHGYDPERREDWSNVK